MSIDKSKLNFLSADQVDKVIDWYRYSIPVDANTISWDSTNLPTDETTLYQGIWSFDGKNWQDLNGYRVGFDPSVGYGRVLVQNGKLNILFWNMTSSQVTATYKIALIAKDNQGEYAVYPTTQIISKDSKRNTQKIALSKVLPITVGPHSTYSEPVHHDLGYVPNSRCYVEVLSGASDAYLGAAPFLRLMNDPLGNAASNAGGTGVTTSATIDENDLYLTVTNNGSSTVTANLHYRIYYD